MSDGMNIATRLRKTGDNEAADEIERLQAEVERLREAHKRNAEARYKVRHLTMTDGRVLAESLISRSNQALQDSGGER